MDKNDPNYPAALEKAIREIYGDDATINPKSLWNPEKEKEYIKSYKEAIKKEAANELTREKEDIGGILIPKKLISKNNKTCTACGEYSFNKKDDIYLIKFLSCYKCYVMHIEGREERWASGWRPNGEK
jgi:hypothetical protein